MLYEIGDGKTLYQVFQEVDISAEYIPWERLESYQKDNWERAAKKFLDMVDEDAE